jgi:hypothetical protein
MVQPARQDRHFRPQLSRRALGECHDNLAHRSLKNLLLFSAPIRKSEAPKVLNALQA